MTTTPPPFLPTEKGLEHTLSYTDTEWPEDYPEMFKHGSPTPYSWSSQRIDIDGCRTLGKYVIYTRYYEAYKDEDPLQPVFEIRYPNWQVVDQNLYPDKLRFQTNNSTEYYTQEGTNFDQIVATAGLGDDACYAYSLVFDQAEIDFIPRLSTPNQPSLDGGRVAIPDQPYFPEQDPPMYPIDAITSFVPDERELVTIEYTLETRYRIKEGGTIFTDTIKITQDITQPTGNFREKLENYMERSYFGNNYYHMGLYPPGMDPIYNDSGDLIGEINEPVNIKQLTRKTYPVKNKYTGELKDFPES